VKQHVLLDEGKTMSNTIPQRCRILSGILPTSGVRDGGFRYARIGVTAVAFSIPGIERKTSWSAATVGECTRFASR
jgi:hypothetical protein